MLLIALILVGAAYSTAYGNLEEHFLLSGSLMVAVQTGACLWLAYTVWKKRLGRSTPAERREN